ncbi:hypothetical protein GR140_30435 (plasmid) [Pseudomonas putida]|uniref:hypothetical protein n=1 Tax=Pseudomonas putida TaxID=303 RepID=UPI001BAFB042|nr:hypothetical protein [Pseudomonas putida]QUG93086.1 hypothetical protein GR140_30435 [Pseudomonas putida]
MITETAQQNEQSRVPGSPFAQAASFAAVFLLAVFFVYLVTCVLASTWLTFQVPISEADLQNASFLSDRLDLQWHGFVLGLMTTFFGVMLVLSRRVIGVAAVVIGLSAIFATSEASALRQGIVAGDMKIGCYTYESVECRDQLDVAIGDAKSLFLDPGKKGSGGYAKWYAPIRAEAVAKSKALIPNTIPGVAFLQSPMLVMHHVDELKALLAAQREEVTHFKAALAKP